MQRIASRPPTFGCWISPAPTSRRKPRAPLALGESGSSNLTIQADSTNLEAIGTIVKLPIAGIGNVTATVTGNRHLLEATGHVAGNGVKYGENGALTVAGDFTAKVPELELQDATRNGRRARDLRDGRRSERQRDRRQGRLRRAGARVRSDREAAGALPRRSRIGDPPSRSSGSAPAEAGVGDGGSNLAARGRLLADDQLRARPCDGQPISSWSTGINRSRSMARTGSRATRINVAVTNVDVANIDALLLREPQLSGRLNGTATVAVE